jgi:hypothetical protein
MAMSSEQPPEDNRGQLIEKLRALETPQSGSALADLSYRRAREALEKAVEEARAVRLAALDDARATRERELTALIESLRALRQSAESEISVIITQAELEAGRIRDRGRQEATTALTDAREEADLVRAEASALRAAAEGRVREVAALEADFNELATRFASRIGLEKNPSGGWFRHLFGGSKKK